MRGRAEVRAVLPAAALASRGRPSKGPRGELVYELSLAELHVAPWRLISEYPTLPLLNHPFWLCIACGLVWTASDELAKQGTISASSGTPR